MTDKPFKTDRQLKATVTRLVNGDGYRRRITRRPRYFVFFWDIIDVHHEEYVGTEVIKAHDDDVAEREFRSRYLLKSFKYLKDRGFVFTLSTGGSLDMVTDKVSIEFRPRQFTSDRMMPDIDIVWQGVGKRSGPFKSVVETHVTLTFRNHTHMNRFFKGASHMPKALRHEGTVYLRRNDEYYDNSGSMLPVWIMLWYLMSDNDRQAFAAHNETLVSQMPDTAALETSVVDHSDDDYRAAISDDKPSASAGAGVDLDVGNQNDAGGQVNADQGKIGGDVDAGAAAEISTIDSGSGSVSMPDSGSMTNN